MRAVPCAVGVVADDGGGVSPLPDRLDQDRRRGIDAERVDDEIARLAVDRAAGA